ncbi:MAG: Gfo/Idh/MocA family oxidoreductase [Acholeplasmataceae bacterium]|nr:Gfo/Idh/MocA family oxidoreductase [Acholeplasmataceae bacterium]
MKKTKIAILGFGQRGFVYANIIREFPEEMELVSVCEINPVKKALIMQMFSIPEEYYFSDYQEMFKKGKIADILIIATMDKDHYQQALDALHLGYDLLLEKPIATEREEILAIRDKANQLGRKVAIAHVLRYTAFYQKIKALIKEGAIGDIVNLSQIEHVGYFHYAHSYVRGNWRKAETSAPMILAKSCHDLDIIRWLIDKHCLSVSSFGSLSHFKQENAPEGSADYCYKCSLACPYNALEFYRKNPMWMMIFSLEQDPNKVLANEGLSYSRCVWKSDNDVVDHQVVNLLFEDDIAASFTMTAFSNEMHRSIKVHGTRGEIEGDLEKKEIILKVYGRDPENIDISALTDDFSYHSGGDKQLLVDFVRNVQNNEKMSGLTDINNAVESHFMALDAEDSRLQGGKLVSSSYSHVK